MCGRFVSSSPPDELAAYFGVDQVAETSLEPNYNVAPTQDVYAVVEDADGTTPPPRRLLLGSDPVVGQGGQDRRRG